MIFTSIFCVNNLPCLTHSEALQRRSAGPSLLGHCWCHLRVRVSRYLKVCLVTCWLVPWSVWGHCPLWPLWTLSSSSVQPAATEPVPTHRLQPANCHPPLTLITTIPTDLVYRLLSVFSSIFMSNRMYKSRKIFNCKCISSNFRLCFSSCASYTPSTSRPQ